MDVAERSMTNFEDYDNLIKVDAAYFGCLKENEVIQRELDHKNQCLFNQIEHCFIRALSPQASSQKARPGAPATPLKKCNLCI